MNLLWHISSVHGVYLVFGYLCIYHFILGVRACWACQRRGRSVRTSLAMPWHTNMIFLQGNSDCLLDYSYSINFTNQNTTCNLCKLGGLLISVHVPMKETRCTVCIIWMVIDHILEKENYIIQTCTLPQVKYNFNKCSNFNGQNECSLATNF